MSRAPPQGGSRKISFNVSEQYDIQDVVGEGAYGVVCSAMHKPSGQKVAIKKITPFDHCKFCPYFGKHGGTELTWLQLCSGMSDLITLFGLGEVVIG